MRLRKKRRRQSKGFRTAYLEVSKKRLVWYQADLRRAAVSDGTFPKGLTSQETTSAVSGMSLIFVVLAVEGHYSNLYTEILSFSCSCELGSPLFPNPYRIPGKSL